MKQSNVGVLSNDTDDRITAIIREELDAMGIHPLPEAPDGPVEVKPCKVTPSKVPGSCADFCRCKTLRSSENLCCTGNFGESRPRPEGGRRQNVGKSEELKSRQPYRRESRRTNTYASCRNKCEALGDRERVRDKCVASMPKVTVVSKDKSHEIPFVGCAISESR